MNSASCSSADGVGYCYGGYNYNYHPVGSGNATSYRVDFNLSPGLVSYDMKAQTWGNATAQDPGYTAVNGISRTIPDIGDSGLFLSIGGSHVKGWSLPGNSIFLDQDPITMDKVTIYDPRPDLRDYIERNLPGV